MRIRNNFNFYQRSQWQLKSITFLLIAYSFYFYSLFFFFFFLSQHQKIYATLCKALPPFPKVKHAPVKSVLTEFAGICIVLTNIFCSMFSGFQKQVLTQGQLTNLLCNKTYNIHRK